MLSFYALAIFFFLSVVVIYLSPKRWHTLLILFLGLMTAFIDMQTTEVSFSILLLLAFGFFLGFTKPSMPLRTALLLAVWLPLMAFARLAVLGTSSAILSEGIGSFVAFIPSIGGSFLGALIRKHSEKSPSSRDALI